MMIIIIDGSVRMCDKFDHWLLIYANAKLFFMIVEGSYLVGVMAN